MNRIILVGNGFDLAHNLKTRYFDFVLDYLSECVNEFYASNLYSDELFELKARYGGMRLFRGDEVCNSSIVLNTLRLFEQSSQIVIKYKSVFFKDLKLKLDHLNWVDIENEYFEKLINSRNSYIKQGVSSYNFDSVNKLNKEFDFLKQKFEEYLIKIGSVKEDILDNRYIDLFCEKPKVDDFVLPIMGSFELNNLLLLSFNYTNTVERYKVECLKRVNAKVNYIHGKLGDSSNPIIFGFGDEYDKSYLEFEEIKNNSLLKHIKSFGYLKSSNYHNLMEFIDKGVFQVYILGHSLGISDRTMLKEIFESSNCLSIKIFYHQISETLNDFQEKTFDISRHFSNKGLMRRKIVSFDRSLPMYQFKS